MPETKASSELIFLRAFFSRLEEKMKEKYDDIPQSETPGGDGFNAIAFKIGATCWIYLRDDLDKFHMKECGIDHVDPNMIIDCTILSDIQTMTLIGKGRMKAVAAFLSGRLKISGDRRVFKSVGLLLKESLESLGRGKTGGTTTSTLHAVIIDAIGPHGLYVVDREHLRDSSLGSSFRGYDDTNNENPGLADGRMLQRLGDTGHSRRKLALPPDVASNRVPLSANISSLNGSIRDAMSVTGSASGINYDTGSVAGATGSGGGGAMGATAGAASGVVQFESEQQEPLSGVPLQQQEPKMVKYTIEITDYITNEAWHVTHRYSDFLKLRQALRGQNAKWRLPQLYPKSNILRSSEWVVQVRIKVLTTFLNAAIAEAGRNHPLIRSFLANDGRRALLVSRVKLFRQAQELRLSLRRALDHALAKPISWNIAGFQHSRILVHEIARLRAGVLQVKDITSNLGGAATRMLEIRGGGGVGESKLQQSSTLATFRSSNQFVASILRTFYHLCFSAFALFVIWVYNPNAPPMPIATGSDETSATDTIPTGSTAFASGAAESVLMYACEAAQPSVYLDVFLRMTLVGLLILLPDVYRADGVKHLVGWSLLTNFVNAAALLITEARVTYAAQLQAFMANLVALHSLQGSALADSTAATAAKAAGAGAGAGAGAVLSNMPNIMGTLYDTMATKVNIFRVLGLVGRHEMLFAYNLLHFDRVRREINILVLLIAIPMLVAFLCLRRASYRRAVHIYTLGFALISLYTSLTLLCLVFRLSEASKDALYDRVDAVVAPFMAQQLGQLRSVFVKFAQYFGGRADMISPKWAAVLSELHDSCPASDESYVRAVVEAELTAAIMRGGREAQSAAGNLPVNGRVDDCGSSGNVSSPGCEQLQDKKVMLKIEDIFERFDMQPIASASIGQVYTASLRRSTLVTLFRDHSFGHVPTSQENNHKSAVYNSRMRNRNSSTESVEVNATRNEPLRRRSRSSSADTDTDGDSESSPHNAPHTSTPLSTPERASTSGAAAGAGTSTGAGTGADAGAVGYGNEVLESPRLQDDEFERLPRQHSITPSEIFVQNAVASSPIPGMRSTPSYAPSYTPPYAPYTRASASAAATAAASPSSYVVYSAPPPACASEHSRPTGAGTSTRHNFNSEARLSYPSTAPTVPAVPAARVQTQLVTSRQPREAVGGGGVRTGNGARNAHSSSEHDSTAQDSSAQTRARARASAGSGIGGGAGAASPSPYDIEDKFGCGQPATNAAFTTDIHSGLSRQWLARTLSLTSADPTVAGSAACAPNTCTNTNTGTKRNSYRDVVGDKGRENDRANDDDDVLTVVVKVQHQHIQHIMPSDMKIVLWLVELAGKIDSRWKVMLAVLQSWEATMHGELDFRQESQNLKEMAEVMAEAQLEAVTPMPLPSLTTPTVLVMTRLYGYKITDQLALTLHGVDREALLARLAHCCAWQLLVAGVFNADPHAGNVMFCLSSSDPSHIVPGLLDFGMTVRLQADRRRAYCRLVLALAEGDMDTAARELRRVGYRSNQSDRAPERDAEFFHFLFRDANTRGVSQQERADFNERRAQQKQADLDRGVREKGGRSIADLPEDFLFLTRVVGLLRGLTAELDCSCPILHILALNAKVGVAV